MTAQTLAEHAQSYLAERVAAGLSRSTICCLRAALRSFVAFAKHHGRVQVGHVDRVFIETYTDHLMTARRSHRPSQRGQRLKTNTLYASWIIVRQFTRTLVRAGHLLVDAFAGVTGPAFRRTSLGWIPTEDEVASFLASIDTATPAGLRDRGLFELLYSTGLRAGEAARLDLIDVDFASGTVRVRCGKGRRDRVVPLGRIAAEHVRAYVETTRLSWTKPISGTAVFLSRYGRRLGGAVIALLCRNRCRAARIAGLTPHTFRHAAATHMLIAGADIRHIQEFLGHADIVTSQVYTHVAIGHLEDALRASHPREVMLDDPAPDRSLPEAPDPDGIRAAQPENLRQRARVFRRVPGRAGHR